MYYLYSLNIDRMQPSNIGIGLEAHFGTGTSLAYFRPLKWCVIHMEEVEIYKIDMWQPSVQNEHCFLVYFNHIAVICISELTLRAGHNKLQPLPLVTKLYCSFNLKVIVLQKSE